MSSQLYLSEETEDINFFTSTNISLDIFNLELKKIIDSKKPAHISLNDSYIYFPPTSLESKLLDLGDDIKSYPSSQFEPGYITNQKGNEFLFLYLDPELESRFPMLSLKYQLQNDVLELKPISCGIEIYNPIIYLSSDECDFYKKPIPLLIEIDEAYPLEFSHKLEEFKSNKPN